MTENVKYIVSLQDKITGKLSRINKMTTGIKSSFLSIGAAMGVGFGAYRLIGNAVNTIRDFEKQMSSVKTLTQATEEQFESLTEQAKQLGSTTAFTASQAAEGMSFLSRAGFDTNQIMQAMPATLSLAAAGQLELADAADIASNVLSGFRLSADQMNRTSDVLAATANNANTNVYQLGEAMKYAAPLAAAAGVTMEETSAAIGLLGNSGIQASMAGTNMRMAISRLISKKGQKDLEKFGVQVKDSNGDLLDMATIIDNMNKKNLSPADIMSVFGERAGTGMNVLLQEGGDALRDFTKELRNADGEAKRVAEGMLDNWDGDIKKMTSAWEGFVHEVMNGENNISDALRGVTQGLTDVLSQFSEQAKAQQYMKDVIGDDVVGTNVMYPSLGLGDTRRFLPDLQSAETTTATLISNIGDIQALLRKRKTRQLGLDLSGKENIKLNQDVLILEQLLSDYQKAIKDRKTGLGTGVVKGNKGGADGKGDDAISDLSSGTNITARAPKNFIINIENLNDDGINISTNNINEAPAQVEENLIRAMLKALNDIQNTAN